MDRGPPHRAGPSGQTKPSDCLSHKIIDPNECPNLTHPYPQAQPPIRADGTLLALFRHKNALTLVLGGFYDRGRREIWATSPSNSPLEGIRSEFRLSAHRSEVVHRESQPTKSLDHCERLN